MGEINQLTTNVREPINEPSRTPDLAVLSRIGPKLPKRLGPKLDRSCEI